MSDDDDDASDNSSDIEYLMKQNAERRKHQPSAFSEHHQNDRSSSLEGDNNNTNNDGALHVDPFLRTRRSTSTSRGKSQSVEAKLALVEQQQAIRDRKRENMRNLQEEDDEDRSDDSDSEKLGGTARITTKRWAVHDANAIVVDAQLVEEGVQVAEKPLPTKRQQQQQQVFLEDSSDEEDNNGPQTTLPQCQALADLQRVAAELQKSQTYKGDDLPVTLPPTMNHPNFVAQMQLQYLNPNMFAAASAWRGGAPGAVGTGGYAMNAAATVDLLAGTYQGSQRINVRVQAELIRYGAEPETVERTIQHWNDQPISVLQQNLLQSFHLTAQTGVVTMSFQGRALHANRAASSYGLTHGSVVSASIHFTGIGAFTSSSTTKAKSAPKLDLGKEISVTLQRLEGKEVRERQLCIHMREPLQTLLDQYCELENCNARKVKLKFDGEVMKLNRTPDSYDMDDDDLIDVVMQ